jgi:oligogalacturonide transport system substrate-binding protein
MRKNVKKVVSVSLAAVMVLSMAACGSSSENSSSSAAAPVETEAGAEEPVSIRFSWWGGDTRHEATETAIKAFEEKYPYITVEAEYGAWNGWEEVQSMNIIGGNAADVMQINWNWIDAYSNNGENFIDLNQYADVLDLTQFPEDSLKECMIGDKLMAVPISLTGRLFFWNKTTFDEVGVPIPTDEASLLAAGAAFKAYDEGYYPLVMLESERTVFLVDYLESKYGKAWVVDGELQYSEEEIQEGLDFICKLEKEHVIPTLAVVSGDMADTTDKNPNWIDGRYAGILEWDSSASKFKKAVVESTNKPGQEIVIGKDIDFGPYQGGFTKISMAFAVTRNCEHPKEAAMLINFLLNDPEGIEICTTERGIPCSAIAKKILDEKGLGDEMVKQANTQVFANNPFPMDPKFENSDLKANPDGVYFKVMDKLSAGEYDSAQAAAELAKGIKDCIEG